MPRGWGPALCACAPSSRAFTLPLHLRHRLTRRTAALAAHPLAGLHPVDALLTIALDLGPPLGKLGMRTRPREWSWRHDKLFQEIILVKRIDHHAQNIVDVDERHVPHSTGLAQLL